MNKKGKGKGKIYLSTDREVPGGEYRYSYNLSLTSALDEVGGQHHALEKRPATPLYKSLGGPRGCSGRVREMSLPQGFNPRSVHRVATPARLTDIL